MADVKTFDVKTLGVSCLSLVGAAMAAAIPAFIAMYKEKMKQFFATKKLVAKYRYPLLLASKELQDKLFYLLDDRILDNYDDRSRFFREHTSFLIGQYLSWTHILRQELQFCFSENDSSNRKLTVILLKIQDILAASYLDRTKDEKLFTIGRGEQMAIGEIMTSHQHESQHVCKGYAEFTQSFHTNSDFQDWFKPIADGMDTLGEWWKKGEIHPGSEYAPRLRRFQHLLIDLIRVLDSSKYECTKVKAAPECNCKTCGHGDKSKEESGTGNYLASIYQKCLKVATKIKNSTGRVRLP